MNRNELLEHLKNDTRILVNPRIEAAFQATDRASFVPDELRDETYEDYPLPIGFGQTISQPTTVAFMLEKLDTQPGQKVLDVGSGSGWTTALLAHLVGERGKVIGVEIIPELVRIGQQNLERHYSLILTNKRIVPNVEIRQAEKGGIGLLREAPFDPVRSREGAPYTSSLRGEQRVSASNGVDRILVSAATEKIPENLIKQLKPNGIMVIPIGRDGEVQSLVKITKREDGTLETEKFPGFMFVPLVSVN